MSLSSQLSALGKKILGYQGERSRAFPGQQEGEKILVITLCHWAVLIPFLLSTIGIFSALFYVTTFDGFQALALPSQVWIEVVLISVFSHILFFRIFNYMLKFVMITNLRLLEMRNTVILKRHREIIPLTNIQDIAYQQKGLFQRFWKYGDLFVLGSSSSVKYAFKKIPNVAKIHYILGETHQKAIQDRLMRQEDKPQIAS